MEWTTVKKLNPANFQRLVGIKRITFEYMLNIAYGDYHSRKNKRGRASGISLEDQLLMMLMYYREYRTFFHIGSTYGISEAQCWGIVCKMEKLLLASKLFHLPGKKALLDNKIWELVAIDVTESPIERPKKNSGNSTLGKRNDIR